MLWGILLLAGSLRAAGDDIYLTVAYCPGYFTGKGAVVKVDHSGQYTIVNRFALPSEIEGCPVNEDANYMADVRTHKNSMAPYDGRNVHLSFGTEWGETWVVDQDKGELSHRAKAKSADEYMFDGYTNFKLTSDAKTYKGTTPHVTKDGFCNNGCFRFGHQDVESGLFTGFGPLPFKSVMSDTAFYHEEAGIYYAQGSYPLTQEAHCSTDETDQCLFAINATTGEFISSKRTKEWVAYKYEDALDGVKDDTVLAWVFGFQETCGKDLNAYAFAKVHLPTGSAELIACISKDDHVHYNPNMGGFSHDNAIFATGSGNPYTGSMQLLAFDTKTGKTVLNSDLKNLPKDLGVNLDEAPFVMVWGMAHMPTTKVEPGIVV